MWEVSEPQVLTGVWGETPIVSPIRRFLLGHENQRGELEKAAAASKKAKTANTKENAVKPTFYSEVELSLKNEMRRKVHINPSGKGKGTLTVEFFSDDELAEFAKRLAGND